MLTLLSIVQNYIAEKGVGNFLMDETIEAQLKASLVFLSGYLSVSYDVSNLGPDTSVTSGEWVLIRPLFWLYCEREIAQIFESSRHAGVDGFSRTSSEIMQDIKMMEEDLPKRAFQPNVIEVI